MAKFSKKIESNYGEYESCVMFRNKKDAFFSWILIVCVDEPTRKFQIDGSWGSNTEERFRVFKQARYLRRLRPNN